MFKTTIRFKILISLVILLLISLGATDFLWFRLVRPILTDRLAATQAQVASRAADTIDQFLIAKKRTLIVHSQSAAFLTQTRDLQKLELFSLFTQDQDILRITLIDETGTEAIKLDRTVGEATQSALLDRRQSPSFIATTFQYGKEYIGPVTYNGSVPMITIAVPIIVPNTSQRLTSLTTATKRDRPPGDILGVLEADIKLDDLLYGVRNLSSTDTGSLFIVDRAGRVIIHQNKNIPPLTDLTNLAPVKKHVEHIQKGGDVSETPQILQYTGYGIDLYGSYVPVTLTGWAAVVEQPAAIALAEFDRITQFALILFAVGVGVSLIVAYLLSRRLTTSIAALVKGTQIIGKGNFDYRPEVHSHDEIADLADSFYQMAQQVKQSIQSLQKERNVIEAERNKLSFVISGIQDAVIAVDLNRTITLINRAAEEILSLKSSDVVGKTITQVLELHNGTEPIDVSEYCPINNEDVDSIVFTKENVKLTKQNKQDLYINIVTGKIKGGAATNLGCIITLHNVSKEMQLEEMKLDFVSMAAHELRTPLTAIRGYLSVFTMENQDRFDAEQNSFLNRIKISTQRLNSLVENLLNVTKIERHGLNIDKKPVDWVPHVKELLLDFDNLAKEQKVELHFTEPTGVIPKLVIDSLKIDEVLSNLVTNAVNYTPAGGHVTVVIEQKGKEIITSVKDDGPGIPETALPHLFTKFFRVSGKLEQGSKGTGLGLFISKAIIEMHKGRIWVESTFGQGSTFSFALPIENEGVL